MTSSRRRRSGAGRPCASAFRGSPTRRRSPTSGSCMKRSAGWSIARFSRGSDWRRTSPRAGCARVSRRSVRSRSSARQDAAGLVGHADAVGAAAGRQSDGDGHRGDQRQRRPRPGADREAGVDYEQRAGQGRRGQGPERRRRHQGRRVWHRRPDVPASSRAARARPGPRLSGPVPGHGSVWQLARGHDRGHRAAGQAQSP